MYKYTVELWVLEDEWTKEVVKLPDQIVESPYPLTRIGIKEEVLKNVPIEYQFCGIERMEYSVEGV